jgi:hypothetical protein
MGGYNSIIRWAASNPPLARNDYVHFTNAGADSLSKILISDLFRQQDIDTLIKSDTLIVADTVSTVASYALQADRSVTDEKTVSQAQPQVGLPVLLLRELFRYDPMSR